MLTLAINLLFAIAAMAALLSLVDTALKMRRAYRGLMREKALMEAGFVLQVEPREMRLRAASHRAGSMSPRRLPLSLPVPARGAA